MSSARPYINPISCLDGPSKDTRLPGLKTPQRVKSSRGAVWYCLYSRPCSRPVQVLRQGLMNANYVALRLFNILGLSGSRHCALPTTLNTFTIC